VTRSGDFESEHVGIDGLWVEPGGAFAHGHEVKEAVNISAVFNEFIECDPGVEPSLVELCDGDF